jgi:quinol monooxygenase YgiN
MIFITAKFKVKPEHADDWPGISRAFTEATRAEAGCLWFDWSRSLDNPSEFVLVEAFRDGEAGGAHVQSEHFQAATRTLPQYLVETPKIVNFEVAQDDWSTLNEELRKDTQRLGWPAAFWLAGHDSLRTKSATTPRGAAASLAGCRLVGGSRLAPV